MMVKVKLEHGLNPTEGQESPFKPSSNQPITSSSLKRPHSSHLVSIPAKTKAFKAASKSAHCPSVGVISPVGGPLTPSAHADCAICGDRATGKHYGSISCDGCKGFFRRTIRKRHSYVCRFDKACIVDKDHRNTCRKCRFDKCLQNGMRQDAVQLERDRISATIRRSSPLPSTSLPQTPKTSTASCSARPESNGHRPSSTPCSINNCSSIGISRPQPPNKEACSRAYSEDCINKLMAAESTMHQMRATVITRTADAYRTANVGDVTDSMHQQLILMVEWAKHLEQFRRLPMPSQIGLLRHFSAQHLVICAAFRSIAVKDAVWLTNESCVPRDAPKIPDVNRVAARVLDHLTEPMRRLHLDEKEYVALKAVAFFDPIAKGVEESASEIEKTREQVLDAFEYHVTRVSPHSGMPLRLANLLLLLPPIMAIARDLVEEAQLAKLFGLANVDELMAELLLPEDAENNTYSHLRTSVAVGSPVGNTSFQDTTPQPELKPLSAATTSMQVPIGVATNSRLTTTNTATTIVAPTPIYPMPFGLNLHSPLASPAQMSAANSPLNLLMGMASPQTVDRTNGSFLSPAANMNNLFGK